MVNRDLKGASESLGPSVQFADSGDWPTIVVSSGDGAALSVAAASSSIHAEPPAGDTKLFSEMQTGGVAVERPEQLASRSRRRRAVIGLIAVGIIAAAGYYYGVPYVRRALDTVSTDDAYVNGHVTFVAARVLGQVERVLVDDNYRVRKGDVLVRLDPKPYEIIVDAKRAAYDLANSNLTVTRDNVRAMVATARAARFKMDHAVEEVDNQIALLQSHIATLNLADANYKRALALQKTPGVISQQEIDNYKAAYDVALQQVYQDRVGLGMPAKPSSGNLSEVTPNLDQNFSTVRQAVAQLQQAAAPLGIVASSFNLTPKALLAEFYKSHHNEDIDTILAKIAQDAPPIKLAEAQLHQASSDLDQAELNLSYCTIYAEIDGVVTGRNVNPGNNVVAGQSLMAVRSLTEIWIDANFKETQLANLRIGQPADLDVDMYGSRQTFKGRISGFTMGTGSTLALLPPENATGNFVKIVQRLPVRIELVDYDPDKVPLFIGLSVTPYVYFQEPPTGPNAGRFLQQLATQAVQERPPAIKPVPEASGGQSEEFPPRASGAGGKPEKKQR